MCRLLAHANALINRVSSFVTKPVDAKYGGKKPVVSSGENIKLNVETAGVSTEASQPVKTTDNSTPVQVTHDKHTHTIWCKICIDSFGSIKELNDHHQDHGVVDCDLCDKKFATQTALDKHMYTHNDLHFVCEDCARVSHSKVGWNSTG